MIGPIKPPATLIRRINRLNFIFAPRTSLSNLKALESIFVATEFLGVANHLMVFVALCTAGCFTIILCLFLIALKDQLGKAFTASRFVNRSEFF